MKCTGADAGAFAFAGTVCNVQSAVGRMQLATDKDTAVKKNEYILF